MKVHNIYVNEKGYDEHKLLAERAESTERTTIRANKSKEYNVITNKSNGK